MEKQALISGAGTSACRQALPCLMWVSLVGLIMGSVFLASSLQVVQNMERCLEAFHEHAEIPPDCHSVEHDRAKRDVFNICVWVGAAMMILTGGVFLGTGGRLLYQECRAARLFSQYYSAGRSSVDDVAFHA